MEKIRLCGCEDSGAQNDDKQEDGGAGAVGKGDGITSSDSDDVGNSQALGASRVSGPVNAANLNANGRLANGKRPQFGSIGPDGKRKIINPPGGIGPGAKG